MPYASDPPDATLTDRCRDAFHIQQPLRSVTDSENLDNRLSKILDMAST
jgi:hypothetical protein